ncbi:PPC domain-containing DNA-binding protein [Rhizohabitans arisaemae]|uniref:PPC domain-containing DNA-binding protein n=1 Tax=Rhizohabitans arisaemae TaxID=2720610 RepID=UPI0024B1494D|nr:PPC domain-containing DNA-binding protein [Rhizohabitans arisaemae]
MFVIEVRPGQEVVETLEHEVKKLGILHGAVVSLIGSVDECCISNMPAHDATEETLTDYSEPFELSGTGEIVDGKPHLHVVLGRQDDKALAGHLHWGRVRTWFVRAYVTALD